MLDTLIFLNSMDVSTHSRLKAAGFNHAINVHIGGSFNTQPPEGGWFFGLFLYLLLFLVSTHSRLKAAGFDCATESLTYIHVSTHSRLKAAGC